MRVNPSLRVQYRGRAESLAIFLAGGLLLVGTVHARADAPLGTGGNPHVAAGNPNVPAGDPNVPAGNPNVPAGNSSGSASYFHGSSNGLPGISMSGTSANAGTGLSFKGVPANVLSLPPVVSAQDLADVSHMSPESLNKLMQEIPTVDPGELRQMFGQATLLDPQLSTQLAERMSAVDPNMWSFMKDELAQPDSNSTSSGSSQTSVSLSNSPSASSDSTRSVVAGRTDATSSTTQGSGSVTGGPSFPASNTVGLPTDGAAPTGSTIPGISLSGHGTWDLTNGYTVVPAGTYLVLHAVPGQAVTDTLGQKIDNQSITASQDPYRVVYGPGDIVPNYTLYPKDYNGVSLNIDSSTATTVSTATNLSEILTPNMGNVHWAACSCVKNTDYTSIPPVVGDSPGMSYTEGTDPTGTVN